MRGEFADAKVAEDEVQLANGWQARSPDVTCCLAPQLHRSARPSMLLLAVSEEACWQLQYITWHLRYMHYSK